MENAGDPCALHTHGRYSRYSALDHIAHRELLEVIEMKRAAPPCSWVRGPGPTSHCSSRPRTKAARAMVDGGPAVACCFSVNSLSLSVRGRLCVVRGVFFA